MWLSKDRTAGIPAARQRKFTENSNLDCFPKIRESHHGNNLPVLEIRQTKRTFRCTLARGFISGFSSKKHSEMEWVRSQWATKVSLLAIKAGQGNEWINSTHRQVRRTRENIESRMKIEPTGSEGMPERLWINSLASAQNINRVTTNQLTIISNQIVLF